MEQVPRARPIPRAVGRVFLRITGTLTRVLVMHVGRGGILGNPWDSNDKSGTLKKWLWRGNEDSLKDWYGKVRDPRNTRSLDKLISREIVFLHLAGHLALALAVLGLTMVLKWEDCWLGLANLVAGFVFLTGHYRHAHQTRLLSEAKRGNGAPSASKA